MIPSDLPDPARRFLTHALVDPDVDHDAVELDVEGRIKLGKRWLAFESTLKIEALRAFRWTASVHGGLLRICGHDEYADGHGEMLWRAYGLIPVMRADGPDITHAARGRAALEQVFLPCALARPEVTWSETEDGWARAAWQLDGEDVAIELHVDGNKHLSEVRLQRWSDAEGTPWRFVTFGARTEGTIEGAGLRLPAQVVAGWFYGEPRFEDEGRFFDGRITGIRAVPVSPPKAP